MIISWYGEACFLLENGGARILIEPPQKKSGIAPPRLKSDILICRPDADIANSPFIINGPGEYEVKGISVWGVADKANTVYIIEMDGIKIAHLGFLKNDLSDEQLARVGDPDILLTPVGGGDVLDAEAAMKLINKLEPSIAIPMLYASLSPFLKESEAKDPSQPKLVIKKKDINEDETKIIILDKV